MSNNNLKKHLIEKEFEITQASINFHKHTIASYKDDIDKLKKIPAFKNFIDYKLKAIAKMESELIVLENDIKKLEGEREMLKEMRILSVVEKELVDFVRGCIELNEELNSKMSDSEIYDELNNDEELFHFVEQMIISALDMFLDAYDEFEPDTEIEECITRYSNILWQLSRLVL